jgi:alpha-tubulin suppressor-like RCC1 family protein
MHARAAASIAIVYEPVAAPKMVPSLSDKRITNVACGHNHTVAVDDANACYTWGFGGYGRYGLGCRCW